MKKIFFNWLNSLRSILFKLFAGKGIGKKFPFLWRIYDYFFQLFYVGNGVMNVGGNKMLLNLKEKTYFYRSFMEDYFWLKVYEPETTKIFKKNIKEGDIVIDVGSSIGYFTLLAASLVGNGKVYSIEPNQKNFYYLCENIKLNNYENKVIAFLGGAWDEKGIIKTTMNPQIIFWSNSFMLDEIIKGRVDFIKIDADGAEPHILKGMQRIIEHNENLKMIIEYYPKYIEKKGGSASQLLRDLRKNFEITKIPNDYSGNCWNLFCKRKKFYKTN